VEATSKVADIYIHELGYPRTFQKIMSPMKGQRVLQNRKQKMHLDSLNIREEERERVK
jgi:hypothetical protein